MRHLIMLLVCIVGATLVSSAQEEATASAPTVAGAEQSGGLVAVPEPSEKAVRYYRSGNVLYVVSLLWGLVVPAALLFTGASAKLRNWAQRVGRYWYLVLCAYFLLYVLITFAVELPLSFYVGFVRQHAYDLSNQTLAKWISDTLIQLVFLLVVGCMLIWIPYLLLRRSPRRWWLYSSLALVPVLVVVILLRPLVFEPMFNTFGPMKDQALEAKILALATRAGIEGGDVFEVDKSVDTKAVNAYVTGFGGTKRIVLWDTIIAKLDEEQLLFVMGHEMGHYVLKHIPMGIVFYSVMALFTLLAVHLLARWMLRRFQHRFGFSELHDPASMPLLVLCLSLVGLVVTPAGLAFSRYMEREADRFGLEITHANHAAATGFLVLMEENLGVPRPGPLFMLFRGTHPSIGERINFFNAYRPWETGDELRYGELFVEAEGEERN